MKKIILIIVLAIGVYFYYSTKSTSEKAVNVSEISNETNTTLFVKGKVTRNFKILFKGIYELKDIETNETILISSDDKLPKIGEIIVKKVQKNDIITINDKVFSLYKEVYE